MRCPNGGKVSYRSEDQAKEARKTLRYKKGDTRMANINKAKIYKCPNCWNFHLTTKGY